MTISSSSNSIESLWVLALFTKCKLAFTSFTWCLLLCSAWLILSLIYWAFPGGPAWGKYRLKKGLGLGAFDFPTGPRGVPVLGSMALMTGLAHHKIAAAAALTASTKRLMAFSLGDTRVIVTCNADVAREILNSSVFADRPVKESAYSLMFNRAIGFAPYGAYWRTLRRISATHLFSPKQIRASEPYRFEIANQMVKMFANQTGTVRVRETLKRASLNNMMWSVFGTRYELGSKHNKEEIEQLREMVDQGYELLGVLNWGDHLPWLAELDPQKVRSKCSELVPKVNRFVSRVIEEHRAIGNEIGMNRDFVDVLLSLKGNDKLSDSDMIAVLWEMIFRGTDTVAVLIEWILARLVLHGDIQSTVHDELDKVVGRSRAVNESDITQMVYLPAVVKEVLRLHPPGPLLSWSRLSIEDTIVDGRHVPAGTTAMVDMWAIMRDPEVWADPLEFRPERFLNKDLSDFSIFGSDMRLAPFGSGRRACPGKALGLTTVTYWVALLLQEFEWRESSNSIDLCEVLKLSSEMAYPLAATLHPRRVMT